MNTKSILGVVSMLALVAACSGSTPTGIDGPAGAPGPVGAPGSAGEVGPAGDAGAAGPIACGDALIAQSDWHSACNLTPADSSGVTSLCSAGIVECRLTDQDGQLIPQVMCWSVVSNTAVTLPTASATFPTNPVLATVDGSVVTSGKCWLDSTCTGVADKTDGAGTQVSLVRAALTYLSPVQDSQSDSGGAQTFLPGMCRNATEHCLGSSADSSLKLVTSDAGLTGVQVCWDGLGNPVSSGVSSDGEGVVLSDFVADSKEGLMGTDCYDGTSVRLWQCTVDANGVASVTCTGSVQ